MKIKTNSTIEHHSINNGASTKVIVETSLIKIWIEGPAVSLNVFD